MNRPRPTAADYMVIALTPALIMTLVGSLVFFLMAVCYQGQYGGRLHFIMAMFVMAAVLIGRISIENGREYAMLFAVPLALVTAIAAYRFVEFQGPLANWSGAINLGLIALIWWCADCLTWDCTVIDEAKDASGEGLLQTVGLDADVASPDNHADARRDLEGTTSRAEALESSRARESLWRRFLNYRRRQHAPGVWVIYFSLAAIPIFGLGQFSVRANDLDTRRHVFHLLVVYVASALGLLLTTSFLGLRRYLRQRRLEMPMDMAVVWLIIGSMMVVGILLFCMLLPRRNPEYSIANLPVFAGSPENSRTSRWAFGNDGPSKKDADRAGQQQGNQQQGNQQQGNQQQGNQQQGNQQQGNQQQGNQQQGNQQQGNQQQGNQRSQPSATAKNSQSGQKQSDSAGGRQQPPKPPESPPQSANSQSSSASQWNPSQWFSSFGWGIGVLLRWAYWIIVIALVAYALWRYWPQVQAAVRNFLKSLQDFWSSLFGSGPTEAAAEETAAAAPVLPRFADFHDPFVTGDAQRWPANELLRYSFQALEAWARDRGYVRPAVQTPSEFVQFVAAREQQLSRDVLLVGDMYNVSAYGRAQGTVNIAPVRRLWTALRNAPPV